MRGFFLADFLFAGMIQQTTFQFLRDIARNNNREWFQANKERYEHARENVLEFTSRVLEGLSQIDPMIGGDVQAKQCVLRIYRDIRFSKDKTPYKTNFGIGISPTAKNFKGPGYYLHLEPGQSFVTGGCWMPDSDLLKAIRQEIDYNFTDFHALLRKPDFESFFRDLDIEHKLKTAPKGYASDHPEIEYLKLKSFTASSDLTETQLTGNNSVNDVLVRLEALHPFMDFLRNALA